MQAYRWSNILWWSTVIIPILLLVAAPGFTQGNATDAVLPGFDIGLPLAKPCTTACPCHATTTAAVTKTTKPESYTRAYYRCQVEWQPLVLIIGQAGCAPCQRMENELPLALKGKAIVAHAAITDPTIQELVGNDQSTPQLYIGIRNEKGVWRSSKTIGYTSPEEVIKKLKAL